MKSHEKVYYCHMPKKILIVEDDVMIRQGLGDSLKHYNYEIVEAQDGEQGYKIAIAEKPDVILLDYFMPVMSGMETLAKLRKNAWGKKVPVIFLTNNDNLIDVNEALLNDVKDYLIKSDTSTDELIRLVEKVIG